MPYDPNIPGFMKLKELETLENWAKEICPNGIIVEIGSFMGRSSYTFAKSCDPSVTVYCVDPWPTYRLSQTMQKVMNNYDPNCDYNHTAFLENTKDCHNLIPLRGKSTEVPWPKERKIDLVFIDARHKSPHVDNDIACWLPRLKPEGILAGHDFLKDRYPDVCKAVMALNLPVEFYPGGSLWTIQAKHFLHFP